MRHAIIIMVAVAALVGVAPASAHGLIAHHGPHAAPRVIERSQKANLKHARFLCHYGRNATKRWGCTAVKWLTRELKQTEAVLHPRVLLAAHSGGYQGVTAIKYAVASCESGGDPYNTHNPKYRGKWQFDQSTWDAYAPAAYRGHDPATVPESIQDWTAEHVPYDAWPNC